METIWIEAKVWKGSRDLWAICDRIEVEQAELHAMLAQIALIEFLRSPLSGFLGTLFNL